MNNANRCRLYLNRVPSPKEKMVAMELAGETTDRQYRSLSYRLSDKTILQLGLVTRSKEG